MTTAPIYNFVDTWNDAGVTFSAVLVDVTDTASASDSTLLDLQVGSVSQMSVTKGGEVTCKGLTSSLNIDLQGNRLVMDADNDTYLEASTDDRLDFVVGGTLVARFDANAVDTFQLDGVGFSPTGAVVGQALGYPNSTTTIEPYTPAGGGDLLAAANETVTGDYNFTGALTRDGNEVTAKPSGFVNVEDYGVDLTGVTADATPINNALTALVAEGGGTLYFPPGDYNHTAEIDITSDDIVLEFAPGAVFDCTSLTYDSGVRASGCAFKFSTGSFASTTLASTAAQYATSISVTSATGIDVGDIIALRSDQELQNQSGQPAYYVNINRVMSVSGTTIGLEFPLQLEFTTSGQTVTVISYNPVKRCGVKGSAIFNGGGVTENLTNGLGRVAICAAGVDSFFVEGDIKTNGFQGYAVYADYGLFLRFSGLEMRGIPDGSTVTEGQTSGFYGIVANRCRTVFMDECTGYRLRHVFDGAECHFMRQTNSDAYDCHRAAFGSHAAVFECHGDGLISEGCYSGWANRAFTTRLTNFRFEDNTSIGFSDFVGLAADDPGELYVENGRIVSADSAVNGANIFGSYKRFVWKNTQVDGGVAPLSIRAAKLQNFDISGNTLRQVSGASNRNCMEFTSISATDPLEVLEHGRIADNILLDYTLNGIRFIGANDVTRPAQDIIFEGNIGVPRAGGGAAVNLDDAFWYGDDIVCRDNKIVGVDSDPVSVDATASGRFKSAPVILDNIGAVVGEGVTSFGAERVVGEGTSTTLTGSATILQGSIIRRRNPAAGENSHWACTVAGTEGSFTGVTGSISSGSTTLTLTGNDAVKAYAGSFINIAGAGVAGATLKTRIVSISADYVTATVATAASTTVSGAAVSRANPTWAEFGGHAAQDVSTSAVPTFADLKLDSVTPTLEFYPTADSQDQRLSYYNAAGILRGIFQYNETSGHYVWAVNGVSSADMTLRNGGILDVIGSYEVDNVKVVGNRVVDADLAAAATITAQTLTDSSGGTASDTIAAIGASYSQGEVADAIASLADEINKLRADVVARDTLIEALRSMAIAHGLGAVS